MIDAPPAAFLSDPSVLAPIANGVLYVIKHASTPIDLIKQGIENLKKANANIIGAIFSQVEMNQFGGHYHYKYMDQYNTEEKTTVLKQTNKPKARKRYNTW